MNTPRVEDLLSDALSWSPHERALRLDKACDGDARLRAEVESLLEAGFDTVSIDLIFGLPDQTRSDWEGQLREGVGLGVQHLPSHAGCPRPS